MNLRTIIVTATTAAVLATSGVAIAGASGSSAPSTSSSTPAAQSSTPSAHSPAPVASAAGRRAAKGDRKTRRLRIRRLVRGAGDVVAKAIGIDRPALRAGLASGKTVAEIATANHVDPQVVIDALTNAATTRLDAAVTAGKITEARATRIKERLPARLTKLVNDWHPKHLREHVAP